MQWARFHEKILNRLKLAILDVNPWFIPALLKIIILLLVLCLVWLAKHIVGKDTLSVFKSLASELKDLLSRKLTVGSINLLGGILIFFIGLTIILGKKLGYLIVLTAQYIGLQQAEQIKESNETTIIFIGLIMYMIVSILAVTANEITKRNRSSKQ